MRRRTIVMVVLGALLVGYDQLDVVARGASAVIDDGSVVGLNTPTPLSVPCSLEIVRPQLAAAAGGS